MLLNVSDGKIKQNLQGNHACQNKRKLLLFSVVYFLLVDGFYWGSFN